MKSKYQNILLFFIATAILVGCAGSANSENPGADQANDKKNPYGITINSVYSWVNLMPGSPSSFFIKGELELEKVGKENPQFVKLITVNILQNNNLIYSFNPIIMEKISKSKLKNKVSFSTVNGILLNKKLDINKNIDIELSFSLNSQIIPYSIKNIKVEKAY